jgi:HTH-type transcriptional regulator/antitoxin HipB
MIIHSPATLALFVTAERKEKKLSQTDIAELVGLKQSTVSAFENKPEGTKLETLFSILSAAGLTMKIEPKNRPDNSIKKWKEEW